MSGARLDHCVVCGLYRPVSSLERCRPCIDRATAEHDARVAAERAAEDRRPAEGQPTGGSYVARLRSAAAQRPTAPGAAPAPRPAPLEDTAYGLAALREIAAEVAATPRGSRNQALNDAWFRCGQLAGAGQLTKQTSYAALYDAGLACGLTDAEVRRVLR